MTINLGAFLIFNCTVGAFGYLLGYRLRTKGHRFFGAVLLISCAMIFPLSLIVAIVIL